MHGPFLTMGMFYLCTFLFSKPRAADTEVHLMIKKKKKKNPVRIYICVCACYVLHHVCECSLYGRVCGGVRVNVHVCFWIKSKTLPIYIRTAKGKSRDVLRVLLCVVGVCFVTR